LKACFFLSGESGIAEAETFLRVSGTDAFNAGGGDIIPVFKQTVQQKFLAFLLCLSAVKIYINRILAAYLGISLVVGVPDGNNEYQLFGVVLGDF
jgi:hypothetical protein